MTDPATSSQDPFAAAAQQERDERHRRRRQALRTGVLVHVAVFVAIQLLLVAVWYISDSDSPWFLFPLFGWGAGLAAHVVTARSTAAR
jgi:hypothetical protein